MSAQFCQMSCTRKLHSCHYRLEADTLDIANLVKRALPRPIRPLTGLPERMTGRDW
jgi:hypothetical protein